MQVAIRERDFAEALDICFDQDVRQVPLQDILAKLDVNSTSDEDLRLSAIILKVENPKAGAKKLKMWSGGRALTVDSYHRLVLCRDLTSGSAFYVLCESLSATSALFSFNPSAWYWGACVALFKPLPTGKSIHGIPLVTAKNPLVPALLHETTCASSPVVFDVMQTGFIASFMFDIKDLILTNACVVPSCGSEFCDGRHPESVVCPGLTSSVERKTLSVSVHSREHRLVNVTFQSTALAAFFIKKSCLSRDKISYRGLKVKIRDILAQYSEQQIAWRCVGFVKTGKIQEAEASTSDVLSQNPIRVNIALLEPTSTLRQPLSLFEGRERCYNEVLITRGRDSRFPAASVADPTNPP